MLKGVVPTTALGGMLAGKGPGFRGVVVARKQLHLAAFGASCLSGKPWTPCRGRRRSGLSFFSTTGSGNTTTSPPDDPKALQEQAHREVRIARRKQREVQDEINLYNSAVLAGSVPASNPDESGSRKFTITNWVNHQVESFMKDFAAGMETPSSAGHRLEVKPSLVCTEGMGEGLFVTSASPGEKEVPRGSLVAFYPGALYMADEVRWAGSYSHLFDLVGLDDRSYLLGRAGGMILDGASSLQGRETSGFAVENDPNGLRPEAARTGNTHKSMLQTLRERQDSHPSRESAPTENPYAFGHKINHPPPGKSANVIGWPYDFELGFLTKEMLPHVPNWHGLTLSGGSTGGYVLSKHAIVLLAAETLKDGDELYLDYGFELSQTHPPEWFTPATLRAGDTEAAKTVDWEEYKSDTEKRIEELQKMLMEWRTKFEETQGRKATREDIMNDNEARHLFSEFGRLRQLEWPEEMANQRI